MNTMELIPELKHISKGLIEPVLRLVTGESWALAKDKFVVRVVQDCIFFPNIFQNKGSLGLAAHQDIAVSDFDPNSGKFFNSKRSITVNISIDKATTENACLRLATNYKQVRTCSKLNFIKIQVKKALKDQKVETDIDHDFADENSENFIPWVKANGALQDFVTEKFEWFDVETEPADLVLFDEFIPHYSEQNKSDMTRKGFYLTYIPLKATTTRKAYYSTTDKASFYPKVNCYHETE